MAESEFLTSAQVLALLQIGRTKLWELVREGSFPAYRIGDGSNAPLRYRRAEVLVWLEGNRVDTTGGLTEGASVSTKPGE